LTNKINNVIRIENKILHEILRRFLLIIIFSIIIQFVYADEYEIINLKAKGYDSHIELHWELRGNPDQVIYQVYARTSENDEFLLRGENRDPY